MVDHKNDSKLINPANKRQFSVIVVGSGLAGGAGLPTSVMPFILRGVTLRGIDSVMASQARRQRAWNALAEIIDREQLREIYRVVPMSEVPALASKIVQGEVRGRIVVDVNA